jgi:hypothetical protein
MNNRTAFGAIALMNWTILVIGGHNDDNSKITAIEGHSVFAIQFENVEQSWKLYLLCLLTLIPLTVAIFYGYIRKL